MNIKSKKKSKKSAQYIVDEEDGDSEWERVDAEAVEEEEALLKSGKEMRRASPPLGNGEL